MTFTILTECSIKRSKAFLTALLAASGLGLLTAMPAAAVTFTFQNSRSIGIDPRGSVRLSSPVSNVRSIKNLSAINIGTRTTEAVLALPFFWTLIDGNIVGLEWENDRDGWFLDDYNQQGDDLLVQLSSFPSRVRLDKVADVTGRNPVPQTQPCDNAPSCLTLGFNPPPLTQDADDEIPFINLGILAPGDSASFDLDFTFTFEDGRAGTLPSGFGLFTTEPAPIPESSAGLAMLAIGTIFLRKDVAIAATRKPKTSTR